MTSHSEDIFQGPPDDLVGRGKLSRVALPQPLSWVDVSLMLWEALVSAYDSLGMSASASWCCPGSWSRPDGHGQGPAPGVAIPLGRAGAAGPADTEQEDRTRREHSRGDGFCQQALVLQTAGRDQGVAWARVERARAAGEFRSDAMSPSALLYTCPPGRCRCAGSCATLMVACAELPATTTGL